MDRIHKVQDITERVAETIIENPAVAGVAIGRVGKGKDLGLVVYVVPKPEDRENFDPVKYGLQREYEGEKAHYIITEGFATLC